MSKEWFEVDRRGFRALQLAKPKYYAIRELIQNALDESGEKITVNTDYKNKIATFSVTDEGHGFRDLKDAYKIYGKTYKQNNPEMRGRFNMGEKQAFVICRKAIIKTTSGTIVFDDSGRYRKKDRTEVGTIVTIELFMTKEEYTASINFLNDLIVPEDKIIFIYDEYNKDYQRNNYHIPYKLFKTVLTTQILKNEQMRNTRRNTSVELYNHEGESILYEMGIPVCNIGCKYSVNIQQRIPMSMDRDEVSKAWLQDLFAEILNHTHEDLQEDESSEQWVRTAMSDDRITKDAVETTLKQRYGDKVVVANPRDRLSIDDAISNGYRVVYGSEQSKDEWDNTKRFDAIPSSSDLFGHSTISASTIEPDKNMVRVANLTKLIAKETLGFDVSVRFINSKQVSTLAQYGNRTVTFNVGKLGKSFFINPLDAKVIRLIIHELGHEYGMHTEAEYHRAICRIGAKMMIIGMNEPEKILQVVN